MVIERFSGTALHEQDNLFDGPAQRFVVDLRAAYNAVNDPDLADDTSWTPTLFLDIEPAHFALSGVLAHAGPFTW
jgi:hypothetical protein